MIRAIHIEDEPRNVELLEALLNTHCANLVKLEGHAGNVNDALALIQAKKPQLVYLDIELNQGNAFELLERVRDADEFDFIVIFITAFNNYAARAFRYHAVDYLLKPISIEELKEATLRAVEKIKIKQGNENILETLRQLKMNNPVQRVGIPVADGIRFLNPDEIVRCEAKGSYTNIYLVSGKSILASKNLKQIERLLPEANFIRVHNSWTINTRFLKKYFRGKGSYMQMEDGSTIPVSLRKKGRLLDLFGEEGKEESAPGQD